MVRRAPVRGASVGATAGAAVSIEALHDAFAGPLFVYALRLLGDRDAAEEVVQDTLLRAWQHADRFDPARGSLASWVFTIARNLTTDRHRRVAARPPEVLVGEPPPVPVPEEVDAALEAWQLADALAQLTPEHRQAIVDVHYRGYTIREAASRLGVPPGTVKSRLYYGLRSLRLQLEERGVVR